MPDRSALHWQRLDTLLAEALGHDPTERRAFLRDACAEDPALYQEAAAMLAEADKAAEVLGESAAPFAATLLAAEAEPPGIPAGMRVGPYRIEGEAGRGGMGVVYLARRADGAFEKTVALKLVKRGMDTDEVLARFRRERQVLASLEHPGIARLLDGGAAPDGRPYLAMEYVEGEPITAYAERRGLGVEARLALFGRACEAVQHAHRRLVVHRDLKPSNILVAEGEDGAPEVKLLDFGIARLLEAAPDEALTRTTLRRLTPAYAAPEQVRGGAITTATDVYALGVVLYELLAGQRPPRSPKPPSAVAPVGRSRSLRGDLDTICLKALREEPEARYPSVEALLDDLHRHREGLPIQARRATAGYRVRKFVGRHRVAVIGTGVVVLALSAAFVGLAAAQQNAARERDRAEEVAAFLTDLLQRPNPLVSRGDTVTVREVLDEGAARIERELADQPELRADLMAVMASAYLGLGHHAEAERLLRGALAERRRLFGDGHESVEHTLSPLAWALYAQGRYAEAEPLLREALALRQRRRDPEAVASVMNGLGRVLWKLGRPAEAERMLRDALDTSRRPGVDPQTATVTLTNLGHILREQGRAEEAEAVYRDALARRRAHWGEEHPEVAGAVVNLALALQSQGTLGEAERLFREGLEMRRRTQGPAHADVGIDLSQLAGVLLEQGQVGEAEAMYRESIGIQRRALDAGQDPTYLSETLHALALLLVATERRAEAAALLEEAVALRQQVYGDDDPCPCRAEMEGALRAVRSAPTSYRPGPS